MKLTTKLVSAFIGGQLEVQNTTQGYLFRGEICRIKVEDDVLSIDLSWMAEGKGVVAGRAPLPTGGWVNSNQLKYEASLEIYEAHQIGAGRDGGSSRFALFCNILGEDVTLFPPNARGLDPAEVRGLILSGVEN